MYRDWWSCTVSFHPEAGSTRETAIEGAINLKIESECQEGVKSEGGAYEKTLQRAQ